MANRIIDLGLRSEGTSKLDVILLALETIAQRDTVLKERWTTATRKAGGIFTSDNIMLVAAMHRQLEEYQTTASACNCHAAVYGAPCYHRAYVLLCIRHAEANAK
jgi:hypothetical protein